MDKDLKALLDAPLADPLKMYLPKGKAKAKRAGRKVVTQDIDPRRLTKKQLDERRQDSVSEMLCKVLDYYATTSVPFERIAEHTKLTVAQVVEAMDYRGRKE